MPERPDPPRQLALDLPVAARMGVEDFLVSPSNEAAFSAVERWPDWNDPVLLVVGPPGAGKSHLAAIFAVRSHAWTIPAGMLRVVDVPHLVSAGALVVEDCDREVDEAALFHLLNAARERRTSVVLTAGSGPDSWGLATADLLSRLRLAPVARLEPPDDALVRAVLVKLFVERQMVVDTSVVDYIALHIDRSVAAARDFIAVLDREGLARRRRITRALVSEVLRAGEVP
ncbi:MAG: hypothetical protein ACOYOJ_08660 [Alsobacter sp.]